MAFSCPHCGHSISIKDAKPGRYKPKCPKCSERFSLTISNDPAVSAVVEKLAVERAVPNATLADAAPSPLGKPSNMPAAATLVDLAPAVTSQPTPLPMPPLPRDLMAAVANSLDGTLAESPIPKVLERGGQDVNATGAWQPNQPSILSPPSRGRGEATIPLRNVDATSADFNSHATTADHPGTSSGLPVGVPSMIGGYRILKELGRGAMGSVYLAKQISLDRDVALKTIQTQWANNPTFIARFTREAYAAAQLTHHNVVQIYDLGASGDINFFSMEYVRGESLDELIKREGKLEIEAAVGYVLQAARGLQFAHNHGMVHRDVKPANLILSDQGIVKVADLGLVKTPQMSDAEGSSDHAIPTAVNNNSLGSLAASRVDVTMINVAMGTPAYMAPEQSTNAAGVDHRADIYSLGCTLYVLLTGRPPFEGSTAIEVITKHKTESVVRPDAIVKRVPAALSEITLKMVAKRPQDRFANLGEVITAFEGFLGIQSSGPFSAKEEHAQTLEDALSLFNSASMAKARSLLPLAFTAGTLALLVIFAAMFKLALAGALLGMLVAATASYFLISGIREHTILFERVRAYLFTARISDWLTWGAGALLFVLGLYLLGALLPWFALALIGVGVGAGFYFVVDGQLKAQRAPALEKVEQLLRSLRLKGIDELALQHFVVRYSSDHWEEFFECLFGYEAKLAAREKLGSSGKPRAKFCVWRDMIVRYIDGRLRQQQEERDRFHLQKIEERGLQAMGVDIVEARKQAQHMAAVIVDEAADARDAVKAGKPPVHQDPAVIAAAKRERTKELLANARRGAYQPKRSRLMGLAFSPFTFALGGKVRFLLGAALLACFAMWAKQNQIFDAERINDIRESVNSAVKNKNTISAKDEAAKTAEELAVVASKSAPVSIPLIGEVPLVSGFHILAAGSTLLILGLFRGWKMSLFALPAAALMVVAPIPGGWGMNLGIGGALAVIGFFFGKTYDD